MESMDATPKPPTMPLPKCPIHKVFMQYRAWNFPQRLVYCPECNDHWHEIGWENYQVKLKPLFGRAS